MSRSTCVQTLTIKVQSVLRMMALSCCKSTSLSLREVLNSTPSWINHALLSFFFLSFLLPLFDSPIEGAEKRLEPQCWQSALSSMETWASTDLSIFPHLRFEPHYLRLIFCKCSTFRCISVDSLGKSRLFCMSVDLKAQLTSLSTSRWWMKPLHGCRCTTQQPLR